ncbi:ATPase component of general energizing module of ECF transporters [Desulfocucumis palustris]|uniref:Energy-coupling factor transporter ATP-binding protein EcfA2 n=1 Tax=Desulfocucumis palustris TaxID=1898651 RepID=A0A2L2X7F1_9FIRM|nr:energy-coupling factor transporter ATPase [Desulfocucumis palustris]GBF31920.1 ATPase component of general energizing module of ECF transporters [Desulfocucumis palustris]
MPIIRVEKVCHTYSPGTPLEVAALKDITLEVQRGEILALAGSTGSGKSTLAMMLNGLLVPTKGCVLVNGQDTRLKKNRRDLWRQVGLVFQYPEYQFFEENVFKEVAFGPSNMGLPSAEIEERVNRSLEWVGLDPETIRQRSPWTLSGGQKRRVALASVLAIGPNVLVLDEPTAGIDPAGKRQILDLIKNLQKKRDLTVVLITHNMDDIARTADRLMVLDRGTVFALGTPGKIFEDHRGLRAIGLDIPYAAEAKSRLNSAGIPVQTESLNIAEVEKEIIKYLRLKKQ